MSKVVDKRAFALVWSVLVGLLLGFGTPGGLTAVTGAQGEAESQTADAATGLAFEQRRVEIDVDPAQESVVARFTFKNVSGKPVRIEDVHTNCGCIRAGTDKPSYEPWEEGTVEAEFKVGSFKGQVEKTVTVQTDLRNARLHQLNVALNIPTLIEIKPELTEWKVGEAPETREVHVKVLYDKPVSITRVMSSRANFDHEIETVEEGREYKIKLTPQSTDKLQLGVLRIETDCDIEKYRKQMAFFGIVKKTRAERVGG